MGACAFLAELVLDRAGSPPEAGAVDKVVITALVGILT